MPTETRSSNTEMVSVPPYIGLEPLVGRYYPAKCRRCGWVGSSEELTEDDAQCTRHVSDRLCLGDCDELERHDLLNIIQAMAQRPHPEPIAWMVGTAFWWTKEEADRDAADTGLPIVGLGPMPATASTEQRQGDPVLWRYRKTPVRSWFYTVHKRSAEIALRDGYIVEEFYTHADPGESERLNDSLEELRKAYTELEAQVDSHFKVIDDLRAQQAERDTLLRDSSGKLIRLAAHVISAPLFALQDLQDEDKKMTRARVDKAVDTADARLKDAAYELRRIADALSASAGPSSPTWSCQACQVEQPTDRACDACGGQTELIGAKS